MKKQVIIYPQGIVFAPIIVLFGLFLLYFSLAPLYLYFFPQAVMPYDNYFQYDSWQKYLWSASFVYIGGLAFIGGIKMAFYKLIINDKKIVLTGMFKNKTVLWNNITDLSIVKTTSGSAKQPAIQYNFLFKTLSPVNFPVLSHEFLYARVFGFPIEKAIVTVTTIFSIFLTKFYQQRENYFKKVETQTDGWYLLYKFFDNGYKTKKDLLKNHKLYQALFKYNPAKCNFNETVIDLTFKR